MLAGQRPAQTRHHASGHWDKVRAAADPSASTGGTETGCPAYHPLPEMCVLDAFCPRSRLQVLAASIRSGPDLGSPAEWESGDYVPARDSAARDPLPRQLAASNLRRGEFRRFINRVPRAPPMDSRTHQQARNADYVVYSPKTGAKSRTNPGSSESRATVAGLAWISGDWSGRYTSTLRPDGSTSTAI